MKRRFLAFVFIIFGFQYAALASETVAQPTISELERTISTLQSKVRSLEYAQTNTETAVSKLQEAINRNGLAIVLFAFFCAWWAKTTGRSAFGWFLLGLFFHVFTAIALLIKTERSS
ncbi:hypothetical protein QWY20_14090 [Alkalimonas sp. MEB108]|uniref:Uncharacterized protein n=1 Tax=Alkalimonas cellulosilytica TaxID=3058395 RepID=A0ABU7J9N8_9GAMM|nr:hypothetical protein [Alkalimonas sp. MEB108]MEE2002585.1 hypothetical protein [Alkalimonas sp. MEB108]